jgi:hypothetical protein
MRTLSAFISTPAWSRASLWTSAPVSGPARPGGPGARATAARFVGPGQYRARPRGGSTAVASDSGQSARGAGDSLGPW